MKVYVVVNTEEYGSIDEAGTTVAIYGVYSSREKAQYAIDSLRDCDNPHDPCRFRSLAIEEVVLDSAPLEILIV